MLCIYHANCVDGFSAAWAIYTRWPEARFMPASYGDNPPDVTGEDVLIVDFSYDEHTLRNLAQVAQSITILDHHKTAQRALQPLLDTGVVQGKFDMDKSGAILAWEYAHPGSEPPRLLRHIQDRDLWRFKMPYTRELSAAIESMPQNFKTWGWLADRVGRDHLPLVDQGEAILRKHDQDVAYLLKATTRRMVIGGFDVPVANVPFGMASDAGNALAQSEAFGATYVDTAKGRQFSLRSTTDGIDVSEIAKAYGGGGHKHAAGFLIGFGWEGDREIAASEAIK